MQARQIDGNSLRYLVVEPDDYDPGQEYPAVVLLHGFGASMTDLAGLSTMLDRTGYLYIFPNAPIQMQIGPGMVGFAWTPPGGSADVHTAERAAERAEELLVGFYDEIAERHGVTDGGIVMGGFSQGGMMTYRFGLPRPEKFAGLVILSGRVSNPDGLSARLPEYRDHPMFVAHGTQDMMISVQDARTSRDFLESNGYTPEYHEYHMAHEINQDVMADLGSWLRNVMPPLRQGHA